MREKRQEGIHLRSRVRYPQTNQWKEGGHALAQLAMQRAFVHQGKPKRPSVFLPGYCLLIGIILFISACANNVPPPDKERGQAARTEQVRSTPSQFSGVVHTHMVTPTPVPPTPTPTPTPQTNETFDMLPPGSPLPSEAECAVRVKRSGWEPRPQNTEANHRVPTAQQLAQLDPQENPHASEITGNFTGTTDEIIQWAACKWGIDVDIVRAQAVVESYWVQSTHAGATTDRSICPPDGGDGDQCYQFWGLIQLTYQYWKSAWPMMRDDTAFSVEYVYALIRVCYDGQDRYSNALTPGYPAYAAGDIWGCVGAWYSGDWYAPNAMDYIKDVKQNYNEKTWLRSDF